MKKRLFKLLIISFLAFYVALPNIAIASDCDQARKYANSQNEQDDEQQDDDNGQYDCE